MKRSFEISTAAVILALTALAMLALTLFNLGTPIDNSMTAFPAGQMPADAPNPEQILAIARNVTIGLQAAGLAFSLLAAFGLWRLTKWGYWLGLILAVILVLGVAPVFFQRAVPVIPESFAQLAAGVIVLILLLLRDTREIIFGEPR
jgi:uncharacterized membrane protein (DUF2068 family)